jgi:hypothetical protein
MTMFGDSTTRFFPDSAGKKAVVLSPNFVARREDFPGARAVPARSTSVGSEASRFPHALLTAMPLRPGTGRAPFWLRLRRAAPWRLCVLALNSDCIVTALDGHSQESRLQVGAPPGLTKTGKMPVACRPGARRAGAPVCDRLSLSFPHKPVTDRRSNCQEFR